MTRWVFGTLAFLVSLVLAAWPLCLGCFQSEVRQQYPSREAILEYLRQCPRAEARELRGP